MCQRPARSRVDTERLHAVGTGRDNRNRTHPALGTLTSAQFRFSFRTPPDHRNERNPSSRLALRHDGRPQAPSKKFWSRPGRDPGSPAAARSRTRWRATGYPLWRRSTAGSVRRSGGILPRPGRHSFSCSTHRFHTYRACPAVLQQYGLLFESRLKSIPGHTKIVATNTGQEDIMPKTRPCYVGLQFPSRSGSASSTGDSCETRSTRPPSCRLPRMCRRCCAPAGLSRCTKPAACPSRPSGSTWMSASASSWPSWGRPARGSPRCCTCSAGFPGHRGEIWLRGRRVDRLSALRVGGPAPRARGLRVPVLQPAVDHDGRRQRRAPRSAGRRDP